MPYYHLYTNGLITSSDELIDTDGTQFIDAFRLQALSKSNDLLVCNIDTIYRSCVLAVGFGLVPTVYIPSTENTKPFALHLHHALEKVAIRLKQVADSK